jgi:hypothetical protein
VLDLKLNATPRELRIFGALLPVFLGVAGGVRVWRHGGGTAGWVLIAIAAAFALAFFAVPALRLPLYRGWMRLTYPIGWAISSLIVAFIYFVVLTPLGIAKRMAGKDRLRPGPGQTGWREHDRPVDLDAYFNEY